MRVFWVCAAAFAAVLAAASPAGAYSDTVGGTWLVKAKVGAVSFSATCRFDRQSQTLTGECFDTVTNKTHPLTAGSVAEPKVAWTYKSSFMFHTFDMNFQGQIDGMRMSGTIGLPAGYSGEFTAARTELSGTS
jgi:hypothetical protein